MKAVSKEIAQKEVEKWLDFKKIRQSKRDLNQPVIDSLIEAISEGILVLKDDCTFIQNLQLPIEDKEGNVAISQLEFKPRVNMGLLHMHLQGVKSGDNDARLLAHVAALTSKSKALIQKLDTEDYGISISIAVFFVQ